MNKQAFLLNWPATMKKHVLRLTVVGLIKMDPVCLEQKMISRQTGSLFIWTK